MNGNAVRRLTRGEDCGHKAQRKGNKDAAHEKFLLPRGKAYQTRPNSSRPERELAVATAASKRGEISGRFVDLPGLRT
jgi:hypothetical protein